MKIKSLLAVLLFYTNLVVGWMSITAYIDLSRTYFEIMSFLSFVLYLDGKKIRYIVIRKVGRVAPVPMTIREIT